MAEKLLFHMQVINMLSHVFFQALHIFLTIRLLENYSCVFIERQPHRSPKNDPEHNWLSQEKPAAPRFIFDNNRDHFINLQNIVAIKNITKIELHPPLLSLIRMEV